MTKKTHANVTKTLANSTHLLQFGSCGFKIMESIRLTKSQLTSLERLLLQKLKYLSQSKNYKLWSLSVFNKTLTKLSLESRMGKGKGTVYTEAVFLKKGFIIFEFQNVKYLHMIEIFNFFKKYFPVSLLLVYRR